MSFNSSHGPSSIHGLKPPTEITERNPQWEIDSFKQDRE